MRPIAILALMLATTMFAPSNAFTTDDERNCTAFSTQAEAQAYFDAHGGSATNNVDFLDADRDGIACEHLPGTPGSASDDGSGFPWLGVGLGVIGVGAVGIGGGALYARSRQTRQQVTPTSGVASLSTIPALPDAIPCNPPPPGWPTVTPDRARDLATMPDATYRLSPEWMQRADAILALTVNRCQLCGTDLMLPDQVRHRTEERRGDELPCDLIVLCDRCAAQLGIASA
ncbi:MAG: excalibur calcium-binding domain-containing protein [Thermomicrobiales bacterium]